MYFNQYHPYAPLAYYLQSRQLVLIMPGSGSNKDIFRLPHTNDAQFIIELGRQVVMMMWGIAIVIRYFFIGYIFVNL